MFFGQSHGSGQPGSNTKAGDHLTHALNGTGVVIAGIVATAAMHMHFHQTGRYIITLSVDHFQIFILI